MRRIPIPQDLDLLRSLRPLVASHQDPTIRLRRDAMVRASRTPDGPATLLVRRAAEDLAEAEAWGPGATWVLDRAPGLLGVDDDLTGFDPTLHPLVAKAARMRAGLRIVRSGRVDDLLVSTILAQRVTSFEAAGSWTRIVRAWGQPAPGPYDVRLPPTAERLAATPRHAFVRMGVDGDRARKVVDACRRIDRLEEAATMPRDAAYERLLSVPGLGPWTAALVLRVAIGDADAVEVGDYHVKHQIAWNLAGEPRATDERMLELLEPFTGHRGRVVRLVLSVGRKPPTYGPRQRIVPVETL